MAYGLPPPPTLSRRRWLTKAQEVLRLRVLRGLSEFIVELCQGQGHRCRRLTRSANSEGLICLITTHKGLICLIAARSLFWRSL